MQPTDPGKGRSFYTIECEGTRYAIYLGRLVGSPAEYHPELWYVWRFTKVWDASPGEAYASAEDAERAVKAKYGRAASRGAGADQSASGPRRPPGTGGSC